MTIECFSPKSLLQLLSMTVYSLNLTVGLIPCLANQEHFGFDFLFKIKSVYNLLQAFSVKKKRQNLWSLLFHSLRVSGLKQIFGRMSLEITPHLQELLRCLDMQEHKSSVNQPLSTHLALCAAAEWKTVIIALGREG